ncbi:MAG: hypothetical protein IJV11_04240 [Muribaculaceae bacterium]|nr:hypothetical protein [Muribaculaceae bacterium]
MKKKLSTFMFGLLLAVGWTSIASAQALPNGGYADRLGLTEVTAPQGTSDVVKKAQKKTSQQSMSTNTGASTRMNAPKRADANPEMVSLTRAQAEALTYKWRDAQGVEHESNAAQEATDPYQMYELLRFVYGNPAFPGPRYTAWSNNDTREREVYYGPMQGGWDLVAASSATTSNDISIVTSDTYAFIDSIYVKAGDQLLTSYGGVTGDWNSSTYAAIFPTGWSANPTATYYVYNGEAYAFFYMNGGGTITIPESLLQGNTSIQVYVEGLVASDNASSTITVNGETQSLTSEKSTLTWNLTFEQPAEDEYVQGTVAAPNQEGYTALIVSVKDDATPMDETFTNYDQRNGNLFLNSKAEVINYFATRINYIKLLTDGMRIGSNSDYSRGTVFNCTGTYNKFFILGKGQSRQKDSYIVNTLEPYYGLMGEEGPFKYMYEEFSPVQPDIQNEITDFYKKMMEGSTYNVAHDCASVIQNNHQFSMTGNAGTDSYYLSGLNFFYPDYRLKYWTTTYNSYTVDGRTMNPYFSITGSSSNSFRSCPSYCAHFAQYNQQYAPKMGIYKITLDAEATKNTEKDKTYNVTLTWISSLNEMSGHEVDQLYTMYIVDENGDTTRINPTQVTNLQDSEGNSITTNPCTVTQVTYEVPQNEHSYTIVYQIKGQENASGEPAFVALSNLDDVIIPGWNDFLALSLDHYESDFKIAEQKNYYRNFLLVANENEDNALTVTRISNGEDKFKLYRYNVIPSSNGVMEQIATLKFDNPTATNVHYTIEYKDENNVNTQEILDYTLKNAAGQTIKQHAYERNNMGIPDEGYLRVVGNGDIVIYPSGYHVNFKSIEVYNGNTRLTYWNAPTSTTGTSPLPSTWILSPGSSWDPYTTDDNDRVYYIEGGGYIAIPNMLNNSNYNDLRVVIKAYGDGSSIARISVNDVPKKLQNNNPSYTTTWTFDASGAAHAPKRATTQATLDFTTNTIWNIPAGSGSTWYSATNNYSDGNYTITLANRYRYNTTGGYLMLGASSANNRGTLTLPAFDKKVTQIQVVGNAGASSSVGQNIYVGNTAVSTATTGATGTNTYAINEAYQAPGNIYTLRVTTNQNTQITRIIVTFADEDTPPTPVEGGMVRLGHLHIVDQFSASTEKNNHPRRYGYVLRYEPENGDIEESGRVEVPVLHTDAVVNGFYTEQQVIDDTDHDNGLTLDVMNADVTLNLPTGEPDLLHYRLQSAKNMLPPENDSIISRMQQSSGRFREMDTKSPLYVASEDFTYDAGALEYFNSTAITGSYGNSFMSYIPTETTWGIDRRYYETDKLDNSYGAPIWKTGVGQVRDVSTEAQMQRGPDKSTQWTDEDGTPCSLYFLGVDAYGDLPSTAVTNIKYEPYMFRVWVYSPDGNLRGCNYVPAGQSTDKPGAHWEGDGTAMTGPVCVYQGLTTDGHLVLDVQAMAEGNNVPWGEKIQFGAVDNASDLMVYVRYYYKSTGIHVDANTMNMFKLGEGDDDAPEVPSYYAVENNDDPDITTSLTSVYVVGKMVQSVTYVNAQGLKSDKPFDGINIVITRYTDGSVSTAKIVR